jgi:tetratricopeptide (TPR) repeat protein
MNLDLIISIDSSPAHLAGSLGKPVWMLLADVADWRWLINRADTPWYPNMRLFRQTKDEGWLPLIARVAEALRQAVDDPLLLTPFKAEGERRAAAAHAILEHETEQAKNDPSPPRVAITEIVRLAEQKLLQGLLTEAEALCQDALLQENVKGPAPQNAQFIHLLGLIAHHSGNSLEAIARVRRAVALKPDEAVYHANLGELYRLSGRLAEAVAACRRAVDLAPNLAAAHNNLGIALLDQGKCDEALAHFDHALSSQADYAQAYINRGDALRRLGRGAEAEVAYRKALAVMQND